MDAVPVFLNEEQWKLIYSAVCQAKNICHSSHVEELESIKSELYSQVPFFTKYDVVAGGRALFRGLCGSEVEEDDVQLQIYLAD